MATSSKEWDALLITLLWLPCLPFPTAFPYRLALANLRRILRRNWRTATVRPHSPSPSLSSPEDSTEPNSHEPITLICSGCGTGTLSILFRLALARAKSIWFRGNGKSADRTAGLPCLRLLPPVGCPLAESAIVSAMSGCESELPASLLFYELQ